MRSLSRKNEKKIVAIIVEGPSDDEALGVLFSRLFDENEVYVIIMHGDISTDKNVSPGNIVSKIGNLLKKYAASTHYKASDFQQVIHIIDMDGVYIPDSAVIYDETHETPYYSETEIRTAKPENIIIRNQKKRGNIDRICSLGKVWNSIPYRAYYMSANLDHVLYGKLNSTDAEKERDALTFARAYRDDLDGFLTFISDSEFSVCDDFAASWKYIRTEKHSLERHSNLGLCFTEIRKKRKEAKEKKEQPMSETDEIS
ncbi:MAG: hypothetical protein LUI13_11255 [Lachnospiraceae bacterium]|nr:hypothetical protein [Lachnospiraceae bacterium]